MTERVSKLTRVVMMARENYPKNLDTVLGVLTNPAPYMKQAVDPRTLDRKLREMTPESMAQIAQTDPNLAESYAKRIHELTQKAPPLAALPTDFTPKEGI